MRLLVLIIITLLLLTGCQEVNQSGQRSSVDFDKRLDSLGYKLREEGKPIANYAHVVRSGNLLFLSGKGPKDESGKNITGTLGDDLTIEDGYQAARRVALRQISILKNELGDLNRVKRIVKVLGMVNATPQFTDHPKVINGFSDTMVEVFGEKGKHARAAVGMSSLPGNIAVEIELIVEIVDGD